MQCFGNLDFAIAHFAPCVADNLCCIVGERCAHLHGTKDTPDVTVTFSS